MELQITGTICDVSPVQQITETFKKRAFVLDISAEYNGMTYEDYAVLQVVNRNVDLLNHDPSVFDKGFVVGDVVRVSFAVKGTRGKKDGKCEYYNNLTAYRIEGVGQAYEPVKPVVTQQQQQRNFQQQQGQWQNGDLWQK